MPHRTRQGSDPVADFIAVARDPEAFAAQLDEFRKRESAALEAEQAAAERLATADSSEAEAKAAIDKAEVAQLAVTRREDDAVLREAELERSEARLNERAAALDQRAAELDQREAEIKDQRAAAITAMRVVLKGAKT